ncbi:TPA: hypothetical protein ACHCBK_003898, partial [Vibrio parahaemolyticus]|uniref:hypothetical protein n=2 Tax=Vibrio parahaemolyticus TaxID=670 RepID=UPI001175724B
YNFAILIYAQSYPMKNKKFILNNQKLTQTKQLLSIDDLRRSMCVVSIHQNNYKYRHLISIYKDKL